MAIFIIQPCVQPILYSRKYWWSLNLAVWAPNDVFIQDLNLVVWYGIAIHTCMQKKIWRILIWRYCQTAKFNSPPNFPAIWYIVYILNLTTLAECWEMVPKNLRCRIFRRNTVVAHKNTVTLTLYYG